MRARQFLLPLAVLLSASIPVASLAAFASGAEWIETHNGKIMPTGGVKGRYVRLYSRGSTSGDENLYTEVEVYGRAATAGKSS